jgi:CRISPR-associated protein Csb2
VAAAYESGLGESARAALLWLEALPPPHLHADPAPARQDVVTAYVPVNDALKDQPDLLPERRGRQPREFPSVVPMPVAGGRPVVYFVWPDARPDAVLRHLLAAVAARVTYLGNSHSPVRARLADTPPAPNWLPDDDGEDVLRVPARGRLQDLDWHHANGLRPPAGAYCRYRRGGPAAAREVPASVLGEMFVFRLAGPPVLEIETTLKVTAALRAAAMRLAQDESGTVAEVVSGHGPDGRALPRPHAAYLALPFVSAFQGHADGHVLGVAVALPRDIRPEERRTVARALRRLDHLAVPGIGQLGLRRLGPDEPGPLNLRPEEWTGPSRRWASVTPVLLDRFPKRDGRGVGNILGRSCEHAGLPRPAAIAAGRYSPLYGVQPSFRFVTRRPLAEGKAAPAARLYTHAELTFDRPVLGPVVLGAGRYFGLGLFRPLPEGRP